MSARTKAADTDAALAAKTAIAQIKRWSAADAEQALGSAQDSWAKQCHSVSLEAVRAINLAHGTNFRVARGACLGVPGQHSWVVLSEDCYDEKALVLDLTLWSYQGDMPVVYVGSQKTHRHTPHNAGSIFQAGMPSSQGGDVIELALEKPLSGSAEFFLGMLGPLDARGWMQLFNSPVKGWPADEILTAAYGTPKLRPLIPIDVVGMATSINPEGLYR